MTLDTWVSLGAILLAAIGLLTYLGRAFDKVDKRFEQVDKRFEHVDARFEQIDKRFESLEARLDRRFDKVDARLDTLEERTFMLAAGLKSVIEATTPPAPRRRSAT